MFTTHHLFLYDTYTFPTETTTYAADQDSRKTKAKKTTTEQAGLLVEYSTVGLSEYAVERFFSAHASTRSIYPIELQ